MDLDVGNDELVGSEQPNVDGGGEVQVEGETEVRVEEQVEGEGEKVEAEVEGEKEEIQVVEGENGEAQVEGETGEAQVEGENGDAQVEGDKGEVDAGSVGEVTGMTGIAQTRIVNGNSTTIEHFPWIVSMQYYGSHRCGGSIITTNRILTAAHCTVNVVANLLSIRAGSTDNRNGGELIAVTDFTNHEAYNPTTLENDISVMVLASRLSIGPAVAVIPLPMQGAAIPNGIVANAAGWGAVCEKCTGTSTLQFVGLPIIPNPECSSMYGESVTAGMLCAGFVEGGRDACQVRRIWSFD